MVKKSATEKMIDKKILQEYNDAFHKLLDLIPEVPVFKTDASFRDEEFGVVLPATKWTIGDWAIESDSYSVYSIEADDEEVLRFTLRPKDYKTLAKACEKRRAELLKQHHIRKR